MTNNVYCPFCHRCIEPARDEDGELIKMPEGGRLYVHDEDVYHDPDYKFEELQ